MCLFYAQKHQAKQFFIKNYQKNETIWRLLDINIIHKKSKVKQHECSTCTGWFATTGNDFGRRWWRSLFVFFVYFWAKFSPETRAQKTSSPNSSQWRTCWSLNKDGGICSSPAYQKKYLPHLLLENEHFFSENYFFSPRQHDPSFKPNVFKSLSRDKIIWKKIEKWNFRAKADSF